MPLGRIGPWQINLQDSVENEWLCLNLMRAFGLESPACEVLRFGKRKVLAVERFDRARQATGWIARLPQEDFCQALGLPSTKKYEADGGPGMREILCVLDAATRPLEDKRAFVKAQIIFWLLAATDGHAKNFSLFHERGGTHRLTPFYDVLSAWPIIGRGANHLDSQKAKLTMAVRSKNPHWKLTEIKPRHWDAVTRGAGLGEAAQAVHLETHPPTPDFERRVPSDFGFVGGRPTHPELLDWLARRLRENGWRIKALHRDIVLSQACQQGSAPRDDAARMDKDARLLWRFPPRRLSAEEVRDTILALAGKLDFQGGGPGFRLYKFKQNNVSTYSPLDVHGPATYRRAVYHQNARASVVDLLTDYDFPDIANTAPRRTNTTTPLQALTLLNHSFTVDMAAALATRAGEPAAAHDTAAFVSAAYRLVLQRPPSALEQAAAATLVTQFSREAFCRALLNVNELIYLD